ncbi:MAG: hypothetical protein V1746_01300 [bacterium]
MGLEKKGKKYMPRENNKDVSDLIERLEQARELLNEALILAKKDGSKTASLKKPFYAKEKSSPPTLDFSMPIRAFVKRHGIDMSGSKKFTLLVAYLAKGDLKKTVPLVEIHKQWNKMTAKGLLGMEFNRFHSSPAKENDWVNTEKSGSYNLRPSWKAIFDER